MFHRQWDILLDEELLRAMENGIRIVCPDNVTRLFFPWVFTYSADYPEKYSSHLFSRSWCISDTIAELLLAPSDPWAKSLVLVASPKSVTYIIWEHRTISEAPYLDATIKLDRSWSRPQ
jgi:Plavaka transposase